MVFLLSVKALLSVTLVTTVTSRPLKAPVRTSGFCSAAFLWHLAHLRCAVSDPVTR